MTGYWQNGDFEGGWHHPGGVAELQIPDGHLFWYAGPEVTNPHDPHLFGRPEVRVLPATQLPEHERTLFIRDGVQCLKIFGDNRAWFAGLKQHLDLPPGVYPFTVWIYADLVKAYGPNGEKIWADDPEQRDGLVRFVLDGEAYDWMPLLPPKQGDPPEAGWNSFSLTFVASGLTDLGVDVMCPFPLDNAGIFADGWTLEQVEPVSYDRTVFLLPQDATWQESFPVLRGAHKQRCTVAYSLDDAFRRNGFEGGFTVHVWEAHRVIEGGRRALGRWVLENAPPVPQIRYHRFKPTSSVTTSSTSSTSSTTTLPPAKPLPEIVTFHVQDRIPGVLALSAELQRARAQGIPLPQPGALSRLFLSVVGRWRARRAWAQALGYVSAVRPGWLKLFIAEQAREVAAASDGQTRVLWRPFRPTYDEFFHPGGAIAYVDTFRGTLIAQAPYIAALEGSNERVGTGTRETNRRVFAFELELAKHLDDLGLGVKAAGPNIAIGNLEPGEELEDARALIEYYAEHGHYWTDHLYKPVTPARDWTAEAKWFEERVYLRAEQVRQWGVPFPHVLGTESGLCAAIERADGGFGGFLSTEGWRSDRCTAGTLDQKRRRYIHYVMQQRGRILDKARETGVVVEALMLFTVNRAWMGWSQFRHESGDIAVLRDAVLARPGR